MEEMDVNKFAFTQIGTNVARICMERGVSQSTLSRIANVDRSHLNRFMKGCNNVSIGFLLKLADGLNVPVTEFFVGLENESPTALMKQAAALTEIEYETINFD